MSEERERDLQRVLASLSETARHALERELETQRPKLYSEFARTQFAKGWAKGWAKGEAIALLIVLRGRGMNVDDETRARITGCTDLERLRCWVERAANAGSLEEVFREE